MSQRLRPCLSMSMSSWFLMVYIYSAFQIHRAVREEEEEVRTVRRVSSFFSLALSWLVRLHYFPGGLCAFEFNANRISSLCSRFTGSVGQCDTTNLLLKGRERRKESITSAMFRFLKDDKILLKLLIYFISNSCKYRLRCKITTSKWTKKNSQNTISCDRYDTNRQIKFE